MDENKMIELSDDLLEQAVGGAINVFYDVPKADYYKYTCRACGCVGIVVGWPDACCDCNSTDIGREIYKP